MLRLPPMRRSSKGSFRFRNIPRCWSTMLCEEVTLGVLEWCRWRLCGSGGFDSYTNVSSESEVLASSTAFATRASKRSAFDVALRKVELENILNKSVHCIYSETCFDHGRILLYFKHIELHYLFPNFKLNFAYLYINYCSCYC